MQRIDDIGGKAFVKQKSEKIVQPSEEVIKRQLKELIRGSVEETLNELLEQEAEKLPLRQRGGRGNLQHSRRSSWLAAPSAR